ncbi:1641_t:CDS:2 [Cetraspora pellucida]|uniref:1641_t:CDS:1 n=1 Tax=Cetraspora pellucida TaxID=1433469 RepID=A0A9N9DCF4_9GLOM|nr:1641_t:CDS:2 [Cetraspora pellucida]
MTDTKINMSEFSNKSTEDLSNNENTISNVSKNLFQISNSISDGYRPLFKKKCCQIE